MLSSKVYSITNNKAGYTRQRGWDPLQERELILAHLNKYSKITREDIVELCRRIPNHASRLLGQLINEKMDSAMWSGTRRFL